MSDANDPAVEDHLEAPIFTLRGQRVIVDSDLARLYGVTTKALNQAVKRNSERFPEDFAFQIAAKDLAALRGQSTTRNHLISTNHGDTTDRSQIVTGPGGRRQYRPWVFTEHGALMAANILRSPHAMRMSIFVIRAFVRLRERVAANSAILNRLAEIDRTLLQHDAALRDLYRKLQPLLAPPPEIPKRRIGFLDSA